MHDRDAKILIGYDGSQDADSAIRCAGRLLSPRRAVVAHVWDSFSELLLNTDVDELTGTMRDAAEEFDAGDRRKAEGIADRGAELARAAGFEATAAIARGRPKTWPVLLELAKEHAAAAIVVGSRGLGSVKSALFGSVSSGVLDNARLPVLIVPPLDEDDAPGPVVIGYDGSAHADAAVEAAGRLLAVRETVLQTIWSSYEGVASAGLAGAPVALVTSATEELDKALREGAERTAQQGARLAAAQGLEAEPVAVAGAGSPWRALCETARTRRAAAVVVGSRGRSAAGAALLGSTTRGVVHNATAPVLVVRAGRDG